MAASKSHLFHILNRSHVNNLRSSSVCATCDDWLKDDIYMHSDGMNYCNMCSSPKEADRQRNKSLEDVLKVLLFPCKFEECDAILKRNQIEDHTRKCIYVPFDCNLCDEKKMSLTAFKDHLKKHVDIIVQLDKPVLKVTVNDPTNNEIRIATLKNHIFLIYIRRMADKLSVEVAKIYTIYDSLLSTYFTVYCKSNGAEQMFKKSFIACSEICSDTNNNFSISVESNKPLDLEIFLCDFDKVLTLAECPICEHDLGVEVYQCENGHNVCLECGKKINSCAICRNNNIKNVKLRHLFPNSSMLCQNFDNGCLAVGKADELHAHIQNGCYGTTVRCAKCKTECLKINIISHMIKENCNLKSNFHFIHGNISNSSLLFMKYNKEIFAFSRKLSGGGNTKKVCYSVQLLYNENIEEARRYRYEIHILNQNLKSVHALKGICQPSCDNNTSSWIYFDTCAKLFVTVNDKEQIRYCYGIVEVSDII